MIGSGLSADLRNKRKRYEKPNEANDMDPHSVDFLVFLIENCGESCAYGLI